MLLSQAGDRRSLGSLSSFPLSERLIYLPLSRKEKLIPNLLCMLFAGVANSRGKNISSASLRVTTALRAASAKGSRGP